MPKVVVIGIDGGTFDLLAPWMERGYLPNLSSIVREGVSGQLESTLPPVTCPAWWSFSTGKNPGRFGSYYFWQLGSKSYEIRRAKSFGPGKNLELWDILNAAGLRCGVINNPIMFPPAKIKDYSVAGAFSSAKADFTHPPEFRELLDEITGGYELDSVSGQFRSDDETLADCLRVLEKRRKVMCHLLAADDRPDFFLGVITESDRMCHRFVNRLASPGKEAEQAEAALVEFFKAMDTAIGDMLQVVSPDDFVIIMSDHGFGNRDRGFYVNEWLSEEGYLVFRERSVRGNLTKSARRMTAGALKKLRLSEFIKARMPRSVINRFAPVGEVEGEGGSIFDFIQNGLIDWNRTSAVALPDGMIYINTEDRTNGIIRFGDEYESLRKELSDRLKNLKDPETGAKFDVKVLFKEEAYTGEFLPEAPDLYLVLNNYGVAAFPNILGSGQLFGPLSLAGHRLEGMLAVLGPGVKQGEKIASAKLLDLTPTILHIMGVPVPDDMDGKVLFDLFNPESGLAGGAEEYQKARYREQEARPDDAEDDEEIRKRLEELGYM